jgi:hypothetical protein
MRSKTILVRGGGIELHEQWSSLYWERGSMLFFSSYLNVDKTRDVGFRIEMYELLLQDEHDF